MLSEQIAIQEGNDAAFESAYLTAEKSNNISALFQSIFGKSTVKKISRKEAKGKYLYKRLDGQLRLV